MPLAADEGVRSMISLPMTSESQVIGALNLYSRETDAFGAEEVSVAEIVAGHASLAHQVAGTLFRHRELSEQLQLAMTSRATIEQAKGILMAQSHVGPDAAFDMLRSASQRENRKLRDIAQDLVDRQSK